MVLDFKTYRDKVLGCWMGKNIGGVLGAPFEGIRQFNDGVEILSRKEIMLPLNNLWGACAEAEFEFKQTSIRPRSSSCWWTSSWRAAIPTAWSRWS